MRQQKTNVFQHEGLLRKYWADCLSGVHSGVDHIRFLLLTGYHGKINVHLLSNYSLAIFRKLYVGRV